MAIEFSCPKCDHLLRTADDKAGLSAKCPACGESIWVPYNTEPQPDREDSLSESPEQSPASDGLPAESEPAVGDALPVGSESVPPAATSPAAESTPPDHAQEDITCPHCHAANEPTAATCRFCGSSLEGVVPQSKPTWTPPKFDVSEVMSSAWRIYTQNIGLLIGCMLLLLLMILLSEFALAAPIVVAFVALQDDGLILAIPMLIIGIPLFLAALATIMLGHFHLYLRIARGETASVGDFFYGFGEGRQFILRGFLVSATAIAATLLGCVLCIAPGLVVMMVAWPPLLLLLDTNPPGGQIIGRTVEFVKENFGPVIAVGAIAFGIYFMAQFVPYVGIILNLFATPFSHLMLTVAYLRITQQFTAVDRMAAH